MWLFEVGGLGECCLVVGEVRLFLEVVVEIFLGVLRVRLVGVDGGVCVV